MGINFRSYSNATRIIIPNSVQANLYSNGKSEYNLSFYNMRNLQNLQIPNWTQSINCVNCVNLVNFIGDKNNIQSFSNGRSYSDIGFANCKKLIDSPFCPSNTTYMGQAYASCSNLTGSPVCGKNVTNMYRTYASCSNLTGSPVCGENVTDMEAAYSGCTKLTGKFVCGNKVTNMVSTYHGTRIGGAPVCGENVTNMKRAYAQSWYLSGNAYFYSKNVTDMSNCFVSISYSNRINIYLPANSSTQTSALMATPPTAAIGSITGYTTNWERNVSNNCYYNTQYNIYIYPVENVAAARAANGD